MLFMASGGAAVDGILSAQGIMARRYFYSRWLESQLEPLFVITLATRKLLGFFIAAVASWPATRIAGRRAGFERARARTRQWTLANQLEPIISLATGRARTRAAGCRIISSNGPPNGP